MNLTISHRHYLLSRVIKPLPELRPSSLGALGLLPKVGLWGLPELPGALGGCGSITHLLNLRVLRSTLGSN